MNSRQLTADRWRELCDGQRSSGLSVEAFCRREGVATSTFFAWRRRLALRSEPAFVEVTGATRPADVEASVLKTAVAACACGPIELWLRDGLMVRVHEGFDTSMLRRVVEALS